METFFDGTTVAELDTMSIKFHSDCWMGLTADHSAVIVCGHGSSKGVIRYDQLSYLQPSYLEQIVDTFFDVQPLTIYLIVCYPKACKEANGETERVKFIGDWNAVTLATLDVPHEQVRVSSMKQSVM